MSQAPDWNTAAPVQSIPPIPAQAPPPPFGPPQDGQPPFDLAPGGYPAPSMAPQVPPRMYFDQVSGLTLPQGTLLAPVGRRIGAYFLAALLATVTLGLGYLIWGAMTWGSGQTPAQKILKLQTWKPQEQAIATRGTMFRRGLAYVVVQLIPFGQFVSFFMFLSGKEHRALHDSMSGTIVLADPEQVLTPVPASVA